MKYLIFCIIFLIFYFTNCSEAKKPDPLYLNSDVIDMDDIAAQEAIKQEQKKRKKKSKKLERWQLDKANQPITMEDYVEISQEKLRTDFEIPEPIFEHDKDYIYPDEMYRVTSYNTPPGKRNIDVTELLNKHTVSSAAILSSDKTKIVYTKSFYYPQTNQTASSAYFIPVQNPKMDAYDILYATNILQGTTEPIFNVGMEKLTKNQFKTLCPIDFSKDSNKIVFKEKIGSNLATTWVTNIIIYDFKKKEFKRLTKIRDDIIRYWKDYKNIQLKDYMFDIYPVGWSKEFKSRFIVYAFAYTENQPLFLGTWSVDEEGKYPMLEKIDSTDIEIDLNGFGLIELKMQH